MRIEQMKDNLASLELKLTAEQMQALDAASAIDLGFPHNFYAMPMVQALTFGGMRDKILA